MRAVPRTAPTIIPIVLLEELWSGDGRGDDEVIADEEIATEDEDLAALEDSVAEDAVAVLVAVDGLEDTMSLFTWEKLTASSMLDSLSNTGAVDEVLSDGEGLSYFELLGQVFATMTRYSMTRRYD
ncbi:hypothetical protein MMC31_003080, partial [Peltigera leucophlebia]|nr:hypothetical protein [Peltigera leucophlebia]